MMPRAAVSAKRVMEVFETESKIIDGNVTEGQSGIVGEVEFRNVSFKYPDAEAPIFAMLLLKPKRGNGCFYWFNWKRKNKCDQLNSPIL